MLCDTLVSVLRSSRADFNARVALAKRAQPGLDEAAFGAFVRARIDPLVRLAAEDRAFELIDAAWDHGLDLVAQRLVGPRARHPWIDETWGRLGFLMAAAPRRLIPALSNAAHQLATTPGARPGQWLDLMERLGQVAADVETLLRAGQVAAWRAGLAHFREPAAAGPWLEKPSDGRELLRVGGFRGFGGLFIAPPLVRAADDQLLVRSGDDAWLLIADSFGATFHRISKAEFEAASTSPCDRPRPADIGRMRSAARTRHTLAVTGSLTHAVLLFAA
jgi:hypothetical protein